MFARRLSKPGVLHQLTNASICCYQLCVDPEDLGELEAAIAAHAQRLKTDGVMLQVPPAQLDAVHLMQLALDGERPAVTTALITNLRALASLRTLAKISQHRADTREQAQRAVRDADADDQPTAKRRAKQAKLLTDSSHFELLAPALRDLQSRSRTARKKLKAFGKALNSRHRKFVRNELAHASGAVLDRALTGWLSTRCALLEQEIEFFVAEIEGPIAMEPTGHRGVADNKAWHRIRGEAQLELKEAGLNAADRRALFPPSHPEKDDLEAKQRRREREYRTRKRAKKRRNSKA